MAVLEQEITDRYAIYNGDCLEVMPTLPDGSIHLSIYSPPFAGLYHYSSSDRDLSNCRDRSPMAAKARRATTPTRHTRIMPFMPMEGDVGCETGFFKVKSPIPAEWQEGKRS
jgi:hypothetical protein